MTAAKKSRRVHGCLHCALFDTLLVWRDQHCRKDASGAPVIDANLEIECIADVAGQALAQGARMESTGAVATYAGLMHQLILAEALDRHLMLQDMTQGAQALRSKAETLQRLHEPAEPLSEEDEALASMPGDGGVH